MFDFATSPFRAPPSIVDMSRRTWRGLAAAGASWTGPQRTAVARRARDVRLRRSPDGGGLPVAAIDVVDRLAGAPATTSRAWVDRAVAEIGEQGYVEIVGIVARVIAIDTFTRLVGADPEPFLEPRNGTLEPEDLPAKARKGRAWVRMSGFPVPPNVLSLVPSEQKATNATAEALYMTGPQMEDPDLTIDDLHRTQIETVATTVSHGNECFY